MANKNITIPKQVFDSMAEAYVKWEEFAGEFEDFVLSSDAAFLRDMRKAKKEHKAGRVRDLKTL